MVFFFKKNRSPHFFLIFYFPELASGPQWRLTPGETRRLLARRVDFKPEEIAAVKL